MSSYVSFTGDGSTAQFNLTFPYLKRDHVHAFVDGIEVLYTWISDSKVQLSTIPAAGAAGLIARNTPVDQALVNWQDGAVLSAADLSLADTQLLYRQQEGADSLSREQGSALRVPQGETVGRLPSVAGRADGVLTFSPSGAPTVTSRLALATAMVALVPLTVSSTNGDALTSIVLLKAITAPANGEVRYVADGGRSGTFRFSTADLSDEVAADPYGGLYVTPAADPTGASGAWVRDVPFGIFSLEWFGFSEANATTNHLRAQSLNDIMPAGSTILAPAGHFPSWGTNPVSNQPALRITKPSHWVGAAGRTFIEAAPALQEHMVAIVSSDVTFEGFRLEGLYTPDNADAPFCLNIGTRFNSSSTGAVVENVKVRDNFIGNADEGLRVINGGYAEAGLPVWYHPKGIEISGNRFYGIGYQALSLWSRGLNVFGNWITMDPAGSPSSGGATRPFECAFRLAGVSNSMIHHNLIESENGGLPAFIVTPTGEDTAMAVAGAEFNDPRDLVIESNRVKVEGPVARVYGFANTVIFLNTLANTNLDGTGEHVAFSIDTGGEDQRRGELIVDGGQYNGYPRMAQHSTGAFGSIVFRNGRSKSNARTAPLGGTGAIWAFNYVPITGYDGTPIEPIGSIEVDNWSHQGPDGLYFGALLHNGAPAGTYTSIRNCRLPFGMATNVGVGAGAGTAQEVGNVIYPSGLHVALMAHSTGYSHSPRYSDNGPNGGGPPTFNPAFGLTPSPVDED